MPVCIYCNRYFHYCPACNADPTNDLGYCSEGCCDESKEEQNSKCTCGNCIHWEKSRNKQMLEKYIGVCTSLDSPECNVHINKKGCIFWEYNQKE